MTGLCVRSSTRGAALCAAQDVGAAAHLAVRASGCPTHSTPSDLSLALPRGPPEPPPTLRRVMMKPLPSPPLLTQAIGDEKNCPRQSSSSSSLGLSDTSPHRAQLQLDGGSKASVSVFVGDRGLCIWTDDAFHQTIGIRKSQLARKFDFAKHVRRRMDPRLRTWAKEMAGSPECSTAMTMPLRPPRSEESSARHEPRRSSGGAVGAAELPDPEPAEESQRGHKIYKGFSLNTRHPNRPLMQGSSSLEIALSLSPSSTVQHAVAGGNLLVGCLIYEASLLVTTSRPRLPAACVDQQPAGVQDQGPESVLRSALVSSPV
ncbi:unnamed protein product [Miscanthus lutarioriparius]|uniref:Uncharacterized protein n=1 Tax=Miscanthus lutarioriparius TaxID=422564 RepID=A0A811S1W1_9POAL|nr:unnamed protein product [Miscanthus lutarioriparius]